MTHTLFSVLTLFSKSPKMSETYIFVNKKIHAVSTSPKLFKNLFVAPRTRILHFCCYFFGCATTQPKQIHGERKLP